MQDVERILAGSSLSGAVRDRIRSVLETSKLEGARAADVARELVAHFEDGLAAGCSVDELLSSFGRDDVAADLIGRSEPRADRPRTDALIRRRDMPAAALLRNLRYAVRRMGQSPGFTATAVVSLAIGIGANTAIFSLVNAAVLRGMPVESPDELVEIYTSVRDFQYNILSYPNFRDVRTNSADIFEAISVSGYAFPSVDHNESVEVVPAEAVSGQYFLLLFVQPEIGRLLGPDDDVAQGAHPVVVLSYGYWPASLRRRPRCRRRAAAHQRHGVRDRRGRSRVVHGQHADAESRAVSADHDDQLVAAGAQRPARAAQLRLAVRQGATPRRGHRAAGSGQARRDRRRP